MDCEMTMHGILEKFQTSPRQDLFEKQNKLVSRYVKCSESIQSYLNLTETKEFFHKIKLLQ